MGKRNVQRRETINYKAKKEMFQMEPLDGSTHQYTIQPASFSSLGDNNDGICSRLHVPVNNIWNFEKAKICSVAIINPICAFFSFPWNNVLRKLWWLVAVDWSFYNLTCFWAFYYGLFCLVFLVVISAFWNSFPSCLCCVKQPWLPFGSDYSHYANFELCLGHFGIRQVI